ncbi:MAG: hypothetical protein JXP72_04125 [Coriobacteriia bacterium]|nr:hypothetical protein [Coriobacteriia bacterium]
MKKVLIVLLALAFTVAGAGIGVACETGGMWQRMDEAPMNPDVADNPVMLKDGYTYMYVCPLDTVVVPANTITPTLSTFVLEEGKTYTLRASGTAFAGDTIEFDAKYSITQRISGDTWTDLVSGYTSEGPELLDLFVNGAPGDWGAFNEAHVYTTQVVGTGEKLALHIYDIYPSNNTGSLTVEIYHHD